MDENDLLDSPLFRRHGLLGCFTKRTGGVSPKPFDSLNFGAGLGDCDEHIAMNLERLRRATGLPSFPHQARQAHGVAVIHCQGPGRMHRQEADALIACQPDTPLAVRTADCLPILLADPVAGVIAAVHAGWRGTVRGIAAAALAAMRKQGASPGRVIASLGPAIGPCCFEIDAATAHALADSVSGGDGCIQRCDGRIRADLAAINRLQLLRLGVDAQRIEMIRICTCCHSEHFFSYRRDGKRTGRQLAVVARPVNT